VTDELGLSLGIRATPVCQNAAVYLPKLLLIASPDFARNSASNGFAKNKAGR
jgi:hypothetical protein